MNTETIVKLAESFAAKKSTLPVLETIAINGHLVASNLTTSIVLPVPDDLDGLEGCYKIGMSVINGGHKAISYRGHNVYKVCNLDEYPSVHEDKQYENKANLYVSSLIPDLELCIKYASKDDYRYQLNGIIFDGANDRLVASDGHRLVFVSLEHDLNALMPLDTAKKLLKALKTVKESHTVHIGKYADLYKIEVKDKQMFELFSIIFRSDDCQHPDFDAVTPDSYPIAVRCRIDPIIQLKKLAAKSSEHGKALVVFNNGEITYRLGDARVHLGTYDCGKSINIALNWAFYLDLPQRYELSYYDDLRPMVCHEGSTKAIVMPMRFE